MTVYPRIFLAMFALSAILYSFTFHGLKDMRGMPAGADFITFWAASLLALDGRIAEVYDLSLLLAAQQVGVPGVETVFAWFYPPTFLLVILPLALLPYLVSFATFMTVTIGAFMATLSTAIHRWDAVWLVAAFPGVWICLAGGQNAFLIGLLIVKPHLAVLFPLVLVARRSWHAFAAAAVTATASLALSTLVLGADSLRAWPVSMDLARTLVEGGALPWAKMPSTFAALRLLWVPVGWAYTGHALVALLAVVVTWRCWRRPGVSLGLRGAALMTATFLVNPYGFDYDLVWLAFPLAWVALDGLANGWRRGDREWLAAGWLLPILLAPVGDLAHVDLGPLVLAGLLLVVSRRAGVLAPVHRGDSQTDPHHGVVTDPLAGTVRRAPAADK
jgi:hypothetical protein